MNHTRSRSSLLTRAPRALGIGALATAVFGACGLSDDPALEPALESELESEQAQLAGARPSPGAPGIGDILYPNLGNGGYGGARLSPAQVPMKNLPPLRRH